MFIALLSQGLSQMDLIVENQQTTLTFIWVSVLAAPQLVSLLLPFALFIASVAAINRKHRDSEMVISQAAGMSRFSVATPVLRLACLAIICQLGINLWVQPLAYREMRATVSEARSDLVATLIRPGEFNSPNDALTIYIGESLGDGQMRTLLISDSRDPTNPATYIASSGALTEVDGVPAILMRDGRVQQKDENQRLSDLSFDQYLFELGAFVENDGHFLLKASDRFLPELFQPDLTNYYDRDNAAKFKAEGHNRLASPLLNLPMGMLALIAVLGGHFSRRGYQRRITISSALAIVLQLLAITSVSVGEDNPRYNVLQYAVPLSAFAVLSFLFFGRNRLGSPSKNKRSNLVT